MSTQKWGLNNFLIHKYLLNKFTIYYKNLLLGQNFWFVFTSTSLQLFSQRLSDNAKQFLKNQKYVFDFLVDKLKEYEPETNINVKNNFVAELISSTNIIQLLNNKFNLTQQYKFDFQLQYGKLQYDEELCKQISIFLGKDFELTNQSYEEFITIIKEKLQQLFEIQEQKEETSDKQQDFTDQEKHFAITILQNALIIQDINRSDNDTILSSIKKLWPILVCICFCGASLGVCMVNAPLHLQTELGASGKMVTLYQAAFNFAQLFGSPICHWISEKVGYKPVYISVYAFYTITMGLMSLATLDTMKTRGLTLGFIYAMRIIQGFTGISQPLGFSMLSASISPRLRSYAAAMNNLSYYIGGLLGTVINAFIAPAAGWYSETDDTITYVHSMYVCCVLSGIAFIFSVFVKECNPDTLLKKAAKKHGIKYSPTKQAKCTWKEAFGIIFTNVNLILSFTGLVLGLGNSVSNQNIMSLIIGSKMHFYNNVEAQKFSSICGMIGVLFCALFAFTLYQPCLKWLGLMPVVAISCWLAAICSIIRSGPTPLQQIPVALSTILNQFGQVLIDSPFITIVSTYTNAYNKARVMGVYQLSNSLSRSIIVFLAGVMYDWHVRNAQFCYTYFAMAAATVVAFIKQPANIKFA